MLFRSHVTPYGIICSGYDAVTAASYRVANGSSQWKALHDFAALHGGIEPYFDKTGALELRRTHKGAGVTIDAQTSVTALKRDLLALTENLDAHYLPAFPALRRMRSSEYLMPLPL